MLDDIRGEPEDTITEQGVDHLLITLVPYLVDDSCIEITLLKSWYQLQDALSADLLLSLSISVNSWNLITGCSRWFDVIFDAENLAWLTGGQDSSITLIWFLKLFTSVEVEGADEEYIAAFILNGHPMLRQDFAQVSKAVR